MNAKSVTSNQQAATNCLQLIRRYRVTLLLTLPALLLLSIAGADEALQYDREAISAGQWFRLFTGHWTHWNADHALWDILMFALLAAVCERRWRAGLLGAIGGAALAISAALWWCAPQLETYRGLSGIDSGLFALAATGMFGDAWKNRQWSHLGGGILLASGFLAKTVWELTTGATVFVDSAAAGFVPVPLAHLVGALTGTLAGLTAAVQQAAASSAATRQPAKAPATMSLAAQPADV